MGGGLYGAAVLALARRADGAGRLPAPDGAATVDNPLCGDRATVEVAVDGARVRAVAHAVRGCIPCRASAAVLGAALPGLDFAAPEAALAALRAMFAGAAPPAGRWAELAHFRPVSAHPSRHRCVLLPFEAAAAALAASEREAR